MKQNCQEIFGCSTIPSEMTYLEAEVYNKLGGFNMTEGAENVIATKQYLNTYRTLSESIGDMDSVYDAERKLTQLEYIFGGGSKNIYFNENTTNHVNEVGPNENQLNVLREQYRQDPKRFPSQ